MLGGLIVLGLFAQQWSASECRDTFKQFAHKVFKRPSLSSRLLASSAFSLIQWALYDGMYNSKILDAALEESFGCANGLFDFPPSAISRTKVAVTATTANDASALLFTNYNGCQDQERIGQQAVHSEYRQVRPGDTNNQPTLSQV